MSPFILDPTLSDDTFELGALKLCTLRLMNDKRYPWIVMVPMQERLTEITDLSPPARSLLMEEIATISERLETVFQPHKLNIAALGNVVRQLHVHVIARQENDPAWPRPVWGIGQPIHYEEDEMNHIINLLKI